MEAKIIRSHCRIVDQDGHDENKTGDGGITKLRRRLRIGMGIENNKRAQSSFYCCR